VVVLKPETENTSGVDALEKLAYMIAEEFVAESKRQLTKELLGTRSTSRTEEQPKVRHAGGGS
jgi:hypothetical protein